MFMQSTGKWVLPVVLLLALAAGPVHAGEPKIVVKETTHDFGTVRQGWVLTHVFTFTNTGNDTLFIRKVAAG